MGINRKKSKYIPVAEVSGAVVAVSLLCMQLFWSKEFEPELRRVIEMIFLMVTTAAAVLLATKARKKIKSKAVLRPVEDSDIGLLEIWLNKDYILKWYHDANEWLNEIKERNGNFSFLHHFIVLKDNNPIGFCQYYDCFDAQEEWYSINHPNEIFSIDYLIGEEDYLRKGYGKEIVKLLMNEIYKQNPKAKIVIQPENENIASCKSLLANGFIYNEEKSYFILEK